ncbi:MAG: cyclic pyranopterin monophosphate synthase MoaC [Anaeromyxobacteraceae bacterium]
MKMIDVGAKPKTERVAIARGRIVMQPETVARIVRGDVEKGDVLAACRLAGVLAAKHTPDIVPLCHPIALSNIEVEATPGPDGVEVVATVKTVDRTGVEMEALAAVMAALLTIYDMLKRYEHGMVIERVELSRKDGGRTGLWLREGAPPAAQPRKARAAAAKRKR